AERHRPHPERLRQPGLDRHPHDPPGLRGRHAVERVDRAGETRVRQPPARRHRHGPDAHAQPGRQGGLLLQADLLRLQARGRADRELVPHSGTASRPGGLVRITYGPWGETLEELAAAARAAEEAGAEVVWVPELHRSATVSAAAPAGAAATARVGTAIALAFARSPMVTALEALDLDELSGGRFVLGLGSGVKRLNEDWHNARWGKPVGHLRETVRYL